MRGGLVREMAATGKGKAARVGTRHFPAPFRAFMRGRMPSDTSLLFVPVGSNAARPFGMDARERACRLASNAGLECADDTQPRRAALLASMAYAWDPAWLKAMAGRRRTALTLGGKPVMAHVPADEDAAKIAQALGTGEAIGGYDHSTRRLRSSATTS